MHRDRNEQNKQPQTFQDLVLSMAEQHPDEVVLEYGDPLKLQKATYGEFFERVQSVAKLLLAANLKQQEAICILGPNSYEWEVVDKTVLCLGGISVGLDLYAFKNMIARLKSSRGSRILFYDDRVESLRENAIYFQNQFEHVFCLSQLPNTNEHLKNPISWPALKPSDIATMLFTSGSTGDIKAVAWTHEQLMLGMNALQIFSEHYKSITKLRTISWSPLFLGTGRILSTVSFANQTTQYMLAEPKKIFDYAQRVHPTFLVMVPRMLERAYQEVQAQLSNSPLTVRLFVGLLFHLQSFLKRFELLPLTYILDKFFFQKLRHKIFGKNILFLFSGSAPIHSKILKFFDLLGVKTYEVYGQTECAALIAHNTPQKFRYGSVGHISPFYNYKISADGELLLKSKAIISHYDQDAESLFDSDGFYATGDLVTEDNGFLYIVGRRREIIKTSTGLRISPHRIESAYQAIKQIMQVVVIGNGRPYLVALIYAGPIQNSNEEQQIRQELDNEIKSIEQLLPRQQRIQKYALLKAPMTVDSGEITTSLKYKRALIEKNHSRTIAALYSADIKNKDAV